MTAERAETKTYRISPQLSVTFTLGMSGMCALSGTRSRLLP